jgi:3-methyladenine DNA glycosylase AlkD
MTTSITRDIQALASPVRAKRSRTFFKTGPGEYGEGDIFIGLTSADVDAIAKKYWQLPYGDIQKLLSDPIHEYRSCALEILVKKFKKYPEERKRVYAFYLENTARINNWDLVDSSAYHIVGEWLQDKPRRALYTLAASKNLWERRIAIVATYAFIKKHQFSDTFALCEKLKNDPEDLLHKACGWMLREVGKQDRKALNAFLRAHAATLPRTTLRYAIERHSAAERKSWLAVGKGKAREKERIITRAKTHGALFSRVAWE